MTTTTTVIVEKLKYIFFANTLVLLRVVTLFLVDKKMGSVFLRIPKKMFYTPPLLHSF